MRPSWLRMLAIALALAGLSSQLLVTACRAADSLRTNQSCGNGQANVTFSWNNAPVSIVSTWLDLSLSDNGWQTDTFISAGPIEGSATSYTWNGLTSVRDHVVRVNQLGFDGIWYPS